MPGIVVRVRGGRYRLRLPSDGARLLRELVPQLRELLEETTDAPEVRPLFPPAYLDDPERDAGYQVLTRDELLESKLRSLAVLEETLDRGRQPEVDHTELTAWMQALNSLRLVLGTRLGVEEDMDMDIDHDDPSAHGFVVYEYLNGLLDDVVRALSRDLPDPDD